MTEPQGNWIERRLGIGSLAAGILDFRLNRHHRLSYAFVAAILLLFIFQTVTGFFLSIWYSASSDAAHASVRYIMESTFAGEFLRSLHSHGSNFLVALLLLHGLQVLLWRNYRSPREINWIFGLILLGLLFGFTITGYLLPWDQNAYWGTQVRVSIMGRAPVLGPLVRQVVQGGAEIGNLTLTRFYALHVLLLPLAALAVLGLHCYSLRKQDGQLAEEETLPYWPTQAVRDVFMGLFILGLLFFAAVWYPTHLGDKADPLVTYPARPEWFFRWLFQSLKYFTGSLEVLGAVAFVPLLGLILLLIPFIDSDRGGKLGGRKTALGLGLLLFFGITGISAYSYYQDYSKGHYREIALWEAKPDHDFDVESFYQTECRECHGRNGTGFLETTPDFTDPVYWESVRTDHRLLEAILKGVPDMNIPEDERMPAYEDKLTPEQAKALVVFKLRPFYEPERD
jgi:ubiquinol-cytochrome c reductase cytochrome b subunit